MVRASSGAWGGEVTEQAAATAFRSVALDLILSGMGRH